MKCTIQSIADELELSRNTVARVLNGRDGVSAKTRKLVLRKAEEMGYGIQTASLPKKQLPDLPESIVFLTDTTAGTPEARSAVIQAAETYLKKQNYTLILTVLAKDDFKEPELPAVLYSPSVRGICMMDITDTAVYQAVLALHLPTAAVFSSDPDCTSAAAAEAFRDRLDVISADIGPYQARLAASLENSGTSSVRFIHRHDALPELPSQDTLPDYFLCEDDWTAIRLIHTAQAAGYSVPEDFSVIGCGNIPESAHVFPALTTLQIPWSQMGTAAARCITDRIADAELSCMSVSFTLNLIERVSARFPCTQSQPQP